MHRFAPIALFFFLKKHGGSGAFGGEQGHFFLKKHEVVGFLHGPSSDNVSECVKSCIMCVLR